MLDLHRILGATPFAGRRFALAALLGAGLLLSGCGQKGPLFLPLTASTPQPDTPDAEPRSTAHPGDNTATNGR